MCPDGASRGDEFEMVRSAELPTWKTFLSYLTGDDLSLILRCHIALEASLNKVIETRSHANEQSELDRLAFTAKVDVCIALGAFQPRYRQAWVIVNRIRNQFAHNLNAQFTKQQADDLRQAIGWPFFASAAIEDLESRVPNWPVESAAISREALNALPDDPRQRIAMYCGVLYTGAFTAARLPHTVLVPSEDEQWAASEDEQVAASEAGAAPAPRG